MSKPWLFRLLPKMLQKPASPCVEVRAANGEADAQFALGLKLSCGPVDRQDLPQAAEWYRRAAVQNHLLAQFNLGVMLSQGQGVLKDESASLSWMSRAAQGGDAGAQFNMGNRLGREDRRHSAADATEARIEAYKWLQLSALQGYIGSVAEQERMTYRMSWLEVTTGNERVRAFVPTLA